MRIFIVKEENKKKARINSFCDKKIKKVVGFIEMMETRIIEYPRSSGLDYHHSSPLIGEIPTNDYTHFHRSIDQLRSLNERGILNTNHIQNVLIQPSNTNSPIPISIIQTSGVYNEIKLSDEQSTTNHKILRRNLLCETDEISDEFSQKKELSNNNNNNNSNNFRIIHSPQQYTITTSSISSPLNPNLQNVQHQNNFSSVENLIEDEEQDKSKV